MTTIVPYEPEHLLAIDLQEAQGYARQNLNRQVAEQLAGPYSYTVLRDGRPVAVLGVLKLWDNRALAWTFLGRDAGPSMVIIHRFVKEALDLLPFRRVEADTPCDFEAGHRWLKMLGFKLEAERMEAYLPEGGDSSLYARVRHV